MNKYIYIIIGVLVGLAGGYLLFSSEGNNSPSGTEKMEKSEQIYTCSMHPSIRQDSPGECPICGMDLTPLSSSDSGNSSDPKAFTMSPTAVKLAGIQTTTVSEKSHSSEVHLSGIIKADERRIESQTAHTSGRIEKLFITHTGQYVRSGQRLASLYSPELVNAQKELLQLNEMKDTNPKLFKASKQKLKQWKIPENQIEEILENGEVQENFTVYAQRSGYVTKKRINTGDYVNRGQALYEITDLSYVWAVFDIFENELSLIDVGDEITVKVNSLPEKKWSAKIEFIDPFINSQSRTAQARLTLRNKNNILKPEMLASGTIDIQRSASESVISIPASAVLWTGKSSLVYRKITSNDKPVFSLTEVTLGNKFNNQYIITDGLKAGDEIVTEGTFTVDAAAQLAGKQSMMNSELLTDKRKSIPEKVSSELTEMINTYTKLQENLAEDNLSHSQNHFEEILQQSNHILKSNLNEKADKEIENSIRIINRITSEETELTLENIRKKNIALSQEFIHLIESYSFMDSKLYINYCPMAKNNQGAFWLTDSSGIRNPYFGASMLKCGETRKTINY